MRIKKLSERDIRKREIAEHLGYGPKLREQGWGALTARENGRIGGLMGRKGS